MSTNKSTTIFDNVTLCDINIFNVMYDSGHTISKAAVARQFGVSPRTVGRAIARVETAIVNLAFEGSNDHIIRALGYRVTERDVEQVLDDNGIGPVEQPTEYNATVEEKESKNKDSTVTPSHIALFNEFCDLSNKAEVARNNNISPRTVGRIVDRVQNAIIEAAETRSIKEVVEFFDHRIALNDIKRVLDVGADDADSDSEDAVVHMEQRLKTATVAYKNEDPVPVHEWAVDIYTEKEEPVFTYEVIGSSRSITITRSDGETRSIEASNKLFSNVFDIVKGGHDNQNLERAFNEMDFATVVERYSDGMLLIDPESNRVVAYPDTEHEVVFTNKLAEQLLTQCYNNIDGAEFSTLKSFTKKLALATNQDVIAELFDFVSATDIVIDEEGYVICWKRVNSDYTDIFSGTFDNTPGVVCEIPANTVDPDRENTCSHGLHVCSKSYLPHFGLSRNDRVVKVRVHPRDFIAIPSDYSNAKARVSRYEVLEDVTDEMMGRS